jgi:hypothetical protein
MSPIHSPDPTLHRRRFISGCTAMIEQSVYIPTLTRMLINPLLTHYQSPPRLPWFPYDTFLPFTHPVSLHQTHIGLPPLPLGCHMPVLAYLDVLPAGPFPASPPPPGTHPGNALGYAVAFPQASGPFGFAPAPSNWPSPRSVARLGCHQHHPTGLPAGQWPVWVCTTLPSGHPPGQLPGLGALDPPNVLRLCQATCVYTVM